MMLFVVRYILQILADMDSLKARKTMSRAKDYSEYKFTAYDRYRMRRNNRQGIDLDYFDNRVRFDSDNRTIEILVAGTANSE